MMISQSVSQSISQKVETNGKTTPSNSTSLSDHDRKKRLFAFRQQPPTLSIVSCLVNVWLAVLWSLISSTLDLVGLAWHSSCL
jgi:hypothetical protein